jgi:glycosyltransferase involved in cell wall biosynthesis
MVSLQTMALLGSYVPRKCGIATFTYDLRSAIAAEIGERESMVLAMDDQPDGYEYPSEVRFQIPQHRRAEYVTAADLLNINQTDCVLIQHEYGIFGGQDGSYVLDLARNLRMPIISTLHTVLSAPSPGQRSVLRELTRLSDRVVVMSRRAEQILHEVYETPSEKVAYIPHGIPDVPFVDPHFFRDQFRLEGRRVMLTFGLLSPGKGIEVAIEAMPAIVARHPEVVYIILGATHPHVLRAEGNAYRNSLEKRVISLGLSDHVQFHNRYVNLDELLRYIGLADIYITPYPNRQQTSSGTLVYAMGAGKAVISTPYWCAEELLADGRGRLFPFGDSAALAEQVNELLDNDAERDSIRKRAYLYCRPMVWRNVARQYVQLAVDVLAERRQTPRPINLVSVRAATTKAQGIPELNLAHLRRMTDDVGILQHSVYSTPNRRHGYCTDDNSRALLTALMYYEQTRDESVLPLADRYLSFIHDAFDERTKRFRNFLGYDRRWIEETPSDDVHGRSIWALGTSVALAPSESVQNLSVRLLHDALPTAEAVGSPRAWAFSIVGLSMYLQRFSGDTAVRRSRHALASRLLERFRCNSTADWQWCEDVVTYDNAKLPHALVVASQSGGSDELLQTGLTVLEWLVRQQITPDGKVSLIGNHGWLARDGTRARFDQQPIEAMALVEACAAAYRATSDNAWFDKAMLFLDWFTGNNELRVSLYDYQTGGCRDGLHADGPNLNQGAESTLAWLIARLTVEDLLRGRALSSEQNVADRRETGHADANPTPANKAG